MLNRQLFARMTSILTASVLCTGIIAPCAAADDTYIYLQTAADIKDLADQCVMDSYSAGKTAVLKCDIDVSTVDFNGILFFSGTFDGAGHTIKGVNLDITNPERGFIGTVGEGGVIKDLTVEATMTENDSEKDGEEDSGGLETNTKVLDIIENLVDSKELETVDRIIEKDGVYTVGGIAGINKGTITGCRFRGSVDLKKTVGGIAGVNEGKIEACENYASVSSKYHTGGIAGKNEGIIRWSVNNGTVNNTPVDEMYATGGIAGESAGVIEACTNRGTVGYKNAGTATGGIAGVQSGNISECENDGAVYGKERVGGIVGNFEPYANITYNPDEWSDRLDESKDKLRQDLDDLEDRIDKNRSKIKDDLDDWDKRLRDIFHLDSIDDATGSLGKAADSVADVNSALADKIREHDSGSGTLSDIGDSIADVGDSISKAVDDASSVTDSLRALNDVISGKVSGANSLSESVDALNRAVDVLDRAESNLDMDSDEVVEFIKEARNTAQTMSDISRDISDSITDSNSHITSLADSLNDNLNDADRKQRLEDLNDAVTEALNQVSEWDLDLSDIRMPSFDIEVLEETDYQLSRILRDIENNSGAISVLSKLNSIFGDILDDVKEREKALEEFEAELEQIIKDLENGVLPTFLPSASGRPQLYWPTSAPATEKPTARNPFFVTAYAAEDDETFADKLLDMDIHDIDIPLNETVCGEEYNMALVRYCVNTGAVSSLEIVGGISGGVGFESGIINGENVTIDGEDFSLNPSTGIKSVIEACINEGDVTAKNNSAGGVTGLSDLGKIKDCINTGDVTVTDGSYSGGISGYNTNEIMRCINTGDVNAENDIGGIAGRGKDISQTYTLTRTDSEGKRIGAVAGTADGNVVHNYFLDEELGGINGVDYNDKAQPVEKEVLAKVGDIAPELSGLESRYWTGTEGERYMPQLKAFTENGAASNSDTLKAKSAGAARFVFTANFLVDGQSIKSINLQYGETIAEDEIPEIPKRDGNYGEWDHDTSKPIIRNTDFKAVYNKSTRSLGYGGEPPMLLVEGDFSPYAELSVEEFNPASMVDDDKYQPLFGYKVGVTDGGKSYEGDLKVRVKVPKGKGKYKVGLITDSNVLITDSEVDGSYLLFSPDGAERFMVLKDNSGRWVYYAIGAGAALLLLILYLCRQRIRERRLLKLLRRFRSRVKLPEIVVDFGDEDVTDSEPVVEAGDEIKELADKIGEQREEHCGKNTDDIAASEKPGTTVDNKRE